MADEQMMTVNELVGNVVNMLNDYDTKFYVSNTLKRTNHVEISRDDEVSRRELWLVVKDRNGTTKLEFSIRDFFQEQM